jgi:hypothetical protein
MAEAVIIPIVIEGACVVGKKLAGTAVEIYELDFAGYNDIVRRVEKDIKYSQYCYKAMPRSFYEHPELDAWICGTISGAEKALCEFKSSFPETPKDKQKPKVIDRAKYTLLPVGDSVELEKALRCCHSSLLTGITVMNQHGLVPRSQVAKRVPKASGLPPSARPRSSVVDSEL